MFESRYYGITKKQLRKLAFDFAERNNIPNRFDAQTGLAGRKFIDGFCRRNNISFRQPEKISKARASSFNRNQVDTFFKNLKELYERHHYQAHCIFNMDESGISTVPNKLPKVASPRGKKTVEKIVSAERGETVTIVCACSPVNFSVPPAIIMPRVRFHDHL